MKKREAFLDILRIICIFLVMYVHTAERAMYAWIGKSGAEYWLGLFANQVAICGTSVFFLISGYLLLEREESLVFVLKHRVLRYLILLISFGLVQQIYDAIKHQSLGEVSFLSMLNRVYSSTVIEQYWFLYAYLGFLIMLPFLRIMVKNMSKALMLYLCVLYLLVEVVLIPVELAIDFKRIALEIPLLEHMIFLPIVGYGLKNCLKEYTDRKVVRALLYSFAVLLLGFSVFYSHYSYTNWNYTYGFSGMYVVVSIAVFELISRIFKDACPGKISSFVLENAGKGVLLVFLAEVELKDATVFLYELTSPFVGWFLAALIWITACILLGMIISFFLRLIPGLKKLF